MAYQINDGKIAIPDPSTEPKGEGKIIMMPDPSTESTASSKIVPLPDGSREPSVKHGSLY